MKKGGKKVSSVQFHSPVAYVHIDYASLKHVFPAHEPLMLGFDKLNYKDQYFEPIECCKAVHDMRCARRYDYVDFLYFLTGCNRDVSTDEILDEMDRQGLRPAFFEELAWFGMWHPGEQLMYPIVAIGSTVSMGDTRCVAVLLSGGCKRALALQPFNIGWDGYHRFLAVRKAA